MIRRRAIRNDFLFGFAAKSLHPDNRLIYVARVTEKLCDEKYYKDTRYARRDDCIYKCKAGRFKWKEGSLHHGKKHVARDLGSYPKYLRANVLLSVDFRYFGKAGSDRYKAKFDKVRAAVEELARGHRMRHSESLRKELLKMKHWVGGLPAIGYRGRRRVRDLNCRSDGAPLFPPSICPTVFELNYLIRTSQFAADGDTCKHGRFRKGPHRRPSLGLRHPCSAVSTGRRNTGPVGNK